MGSRCIALLFFNLGVGCGWVVNPTARPLYSLPGKTQYQLYRMGRDKAVGIATRYGLDCPGIESQGGKIFCTHPDRPSLLYNGYRVFPGGEAAEACR